jgi:Kef-type K+ transport system membrane component KefB
MAGDRHRAGPAAQWTAAPIQRPPPDHGQDQPEYFAQEGSSMHDPTAVSSGGADVWLQALRHTVVEDVLQPVLVQLIVIILAARLGAVVFRRIGQPAVVGEIAAGLVLGPSVLGRFFPQVSDAVFHPAVAGLPGEVSDQLLHWIFTALSQLGLILLLFLIGLEFDFAPLRRHGRAALGISIAGIAMPFALGIALTPLLLSSEQLGVHPDRVGPTPALGFALFLGTSLSITAIPILGRLMMEMGITRTRLGSVTITAAAADDATGWILLAMVAAVVRAQFSPIPFLQMVGSTAGFALFMIFVAGPIVRWYARRTVRQNDGEITLNNLAVLLAVILGCAIVTSLIGIFAIFGAFFLGAVLSAEEEFRQAVSRRLRDVVSAFFLPIFFTYTGLRTNVGALSSPELWLLCGLVLAAAVVGKFGGCALAARLCGFSNRDAACIGVMMNTRALMELIVINVGYEMGVIPPSVFCMLVLMALITTIMTTPILIRLMRGTDLEPCILKSGFIRQPRA